MSRALFVTPSSSWQVRSGAEQRTALLYEAVSRLCAVEVLVVQNGIRATFERGDRKGIVGTLTLPDYGLAALLRPARSLPALAGRIDWHRYDIVVGRYVPPIAQLPIPAGVPKVIDADDAVRRFGPFLAGIPLHIADRIKARVRTRVFRRVLSAAAHVFFCSSLDRNTFLSVRGSVLPNVPFGDPRPLPAPPAGSATILFVGSLWYAPNREGVDWFLSTVWSRIKRFRPDATLRLVGGASPALRAKWADTPGVELAGFVEDLANEYQSAAFTIAPIWHGAGTSIKILESAAFGRVCVTTTIGYAPLKDLFRAGTSIMAASTADEMYKECVTLLQRQAKAWDMERRGAEVVHSALTAKAFDACVRKGVQSALDRGSRAAR